MRIYFMSYSYDIGFKVFIYPLLLLSWSCTAVLAWATSGPDATESFSGRVLAADYFPAGDGVRGTLTAVFQITRQGSISRLSADPANLVGNIVLTHCYPPSTPTLQDAALLLSTYAAANWRTEVEMVLSAENTATSVVSYRIHRLVMPFTGSQSPLQLICGQ